MIATLPLTGASTRTTTYGSKITRTAPRWAASRPSKASRTTASGSLMSFFICPPILGPTFDPARYRTGRATDSIPDGETSRWPREGAAGESDARTGVAVARLAVFGQPALVRAHGQEVVHRERLLTVLRLSRALPELAYLSHHFVAVRGVARRDRRPEAHLDLDPAREESPADPLRPVLPWRHCLVRAADPDRHDAEAVLRCEYGGARLDLPDLAVTRACALGEDQQVPSFRDQFVHVIAGAAVEAATGPAHWDRVEHERSAPRTPARLVEIIRGGRDRGPLAPLGRDRAQDRRRVQVAVVVGHEDDGIGHLLAQHVASVDAALDVQVQQRGQDPGEDAAADEARARAARP